MTPERWQQINNLLEEALELESGDRCAFLDRACGTDDTLRRKLEALLAAHGKTEKFIETPALEAAARELAGQGRSFVGRQFGHYEILITLGVGGMGEVYCARDSRLERMVALKILPATFAADRSRTQRFMREARAASAINHPNVATVYDIGEADGINFIAMEYVEGQTLKARLAGEPLTPDEVVRISIQIAEGLEAAHTKGITHRDIKPANLMLTGQGQVKVLDFGLAKMTRVELSDDGTSMTAAGTVVGTVRYMSPEQVLGRELDHRTDIFSLGVVLHEMATGELPFGGVSVGEAMDQIVHAVPPSLLRINSRAPAELEWIVRKCLEKDRERRYQSVRELLVDLKNLERDNLERDTLSVPPAYRNTFDHGSKNSRLAWAALAVVAGVLLLTVSLIVWQRRTATPPGGIKRLNLALSPTEQLGNANVPLLALSPDGGVLAYIASRGGGEQQIYVRALDQLEGLPLPGTEGGFAPFFSPDGKWLGFFASGKLKKVALSGGTPITICDARLGQGGSWGTDDVIVMVPALFSSISRVSAGGATPERITTPKSGRSHSQPEILPNGDAIIFTTSVSGGSSFDQPQIEVYSLKTGTQKVLVTDGSHAHYAPTGHLVFARNGTLMAVRFDAVRLEVSGTPVPILEGVMQSGSASQFTFSRLGSIAYIPGVFTLRQLVWVDRKGQVEPITAPPRLYAHPRLSPDGQQLAVTVVGPQNDIWLFDLVRGGLSRFTFEDNNHYPIWSPDGKHIIFRSNKPGDAPNLFRKAVDRTGEAERLTTSDNEQVPESLTPDGKTFVFVELGKTWDIWKLPLEGERNPELFLGTPFLDGTPQLSPDGQWLAYTSDESGKLEIYVRPFPGPGARVPISTEGGVQAAWRGDGRELFYWKGNQMMVVPITLRPQFSAGKPTILFEGRFVGIQGKNYDVTRDGQRFLFVETVRQQVPTHFNFVLNWFEELKNR